MFILSPPLSLTFDILYLLEFSQIFFPLMDTFDFHLLEVLSRDKRIEQQSAPLSQHSVNLPGCAP